MTKKSVASIEENKNDPARNKHDIPKTQDPFHTFIGQSPIAMAIGRAGVLLYANQQFVDMYGYSKPGEIIGKPTLDFFAPESKKQLQDMVEQAAAFDYEKVEKDFTALHRNGSIFYVRLIGKKINLDDGPANQFYSINISELKTSDKRLGNKEELFQQLNERSMMGVYIVQDGVLKYVNHALAAIFGYEPKELIGASPLLVVVPEDQPFVEKNMQCRLSGKKDTLRYEFRGINRDGGIKNIEVWGGRGIFNNKPAVIGNLVDITKDKQDDLARKQIQERFKAAFMTGQDAFYISTRDDAQILEVNNKFQDVFGYSRKEVIGKYAKDLNLYVDYKERMRIAEILKTTGSVSNFETKMRKKSGEIIDVAFSISTLGEENAGLILGVARDVTERIRKKEELHKRNNELMESEARFRALTEQSPIAISVTRKGLVWFVNKKLLEIFGYNDFGEIEGKSPTCFYSSSVREKINKHIQDRAASLPVVSNYETIAVRKDGSEFPIKVNIGRVDFPEGHVHLAFFEDITIQKETEEHIKQSEARYRSLVENQTYLISRNDLLGNLTFVNNVYCDTFGKTSKELIGTSINNTIIPDDLPKVFAILQEVSHPPFYKQSENRLSTKNGVRIFRWENSGIRDENGEIVEYQGVGYDITEQKQYEENIKTSYKKLHDTFIEAIDLLAIACEQRDPYTAGHQERVSQLAVAIGKKMGLSDQIVEGIRIAGIIHDIGKISLPSELLSKPSKLTDLEYSLIMTHAKNGFLILSKFVFPWPLAEIVYQHHEREDGSGYPQHIKGNEIILEAKILAVADVVEAMSSHRPYRPALGIDKALQEIKMNQGIRFDQDVVEVCLRLFSEGQFSFQRSESYRGF
jgi:PAS domain S-box-containing protein